MIKMIIEKKEGCLFTLKDEKNNTYKKDFIFYDIEEPKENDIMLIPECILKEINIFNFGPVDESKINKDELIKIINKEKEYYIQRYYG